MEKGTEDTSTLVQVEEVKCAIRKLSFVTVFEMCYSETVVRDGFVTRTCSQSQGARVWVLPDVLLL
jgi:hypothetical protein